MNETKKFSRSEIIGTAKMAAIFLLSSAFGAGLIYSLQPPKPAAPMLIYSVFLFVSDEPITDFVPHAEMMKLGVSGYVIGGRGPRYVGNIQLATTPGVPASLNTSLPTRPLHPFPHCRIDVISDQTERGFRTKLKFFGDERTSHVFELRPSEFRAIVLSPGGRDGANRVYAILQVEEALPLVSGVTLPNPVRARTAPTR